MTESKFNSVRMLIGGLIIVIVGGFLIWRMGWLSPRGAASQMSVSAEQIIAIAEAIEAYEIKHKKRPERLEQLVDAGLLSAAQLYDQRRGGVKPTVDSKTGHFIPHPDVLYFPAVTSKDPPQLVLLCTLLLREEQDKYQVITNDGAYVELDHHELITALQKTYTYIGRVLRGGSGDVILNY